MSAAAASATPSAAVDAKKPASAPVAVKYLPAKGAVASDLKADALNSVVCPTEFVPVGSDGAPSGQPPGLISLFLGGGISNCPVWQTILTDELTKRGKCKVRKNKPPRPPCAVVLIALRLCAWSSVCIAFAGVGTAESSEGVVRRQ
jgi:hypothetical protein